MKNAFLILLFTIVPLLSANAQCDCITRNIEEHKIRQCPPKPIAVDKFYQIAVSIQEVNGEKFVLMTIRFPQNAKTIASDLQLFTNSETALILKLTKSGKDYVNGSPICHSQFKIKETDMKTLKNSTISSVRFIFTGEDMNRTFEAKQNGDILINNLNCLD